MKNTDLCDAIQYVDDKYLEIANFSHKEISQDQNNSRPQFRKTYRVLLIAVAVSLLVLTASAANVFNIRSLITGTWKSYKAYHMLDQAMEDAGFKISVKEGFDNQYFFTEVFVNETSAMDSENQEAISYKEIIVIYSNDSGDNLMLNAHPDLEDIPSTPSPVVSSKTIANVTVNYYLDHYRYVPDDYELSEEDRIWGQQPGNYIGYGSESIEETSVAFLSWSAGGIYYSIMDSDSSESPEFLFSMAEELINNAK